MKKKTGIVAVLVPLLTIAANAGVISVNLTNVDAPRQILETESTGLIDTTGWVNFNTAASLTTNNVGGSVVDVVASRDAKISNTARDSAGSGFLALYEAGLKDWDGAALDDIHFTISDMTDYLAAEGDASYNLIVYYKSAKPAASPDNITIGLSTNSLAVVNPDGSLISVNDSFVEAANPESNYIIYSGLTADSTTVYLNRVNKDGLLTGFQIQTIPEPATLGMVAVFGGAVLFIRRRLMI